MYLLTLSDQTLMLDDSRHSAHGEEAEGMALIGTTFVPL
jgi:hypothetical protein